MRITSEIKLPIEIKVNNKPVFYKDIKIGMLVDTRVKDGKIIATIKIDKKKIKSVRKILEAAMKLTERVIK